MTHSSPFAVIAFAFAAGIWLAAQFTFPIWFSALVACIAIVIAVVTRKQADRTWCALFVTLLAAGALRYTLSAPTPGPNSPATYNGREVVLEGTVLDEPDARPEFTYLRVQPQRLVVDSASVGVDGIVLLRADNSVQWRYGDVVRAYGKLDAPPVMSEFDYRTYLARKGVFSWMSMTTRVQRIGEGRGSPLIAALLWVKAKVRLSSQQVMPAPESALLNGILIGDDNEIPSYIQDAFRRTGTSHIVAISGFNVNVVIAVIVFLLSRVLSRRRAAGVAIAAIVLYTLFTGASASVVRAAVMSIIALVGMLLWRRGYTLNTLCAAAFFMLLYDPQYLFDYGYQLSVAATLGLVLYAGRIKTALEHWIERRLSRECAQQSAEILSDVFLTTLAANLTSLPLLLANGYELSLGAFLTNALVLPLQSWAMVTGIAASVTGLFSMALGSIVALPAYGLLTTTIRVVQWMSSARLGEIPTPWFGTPHAMACYLALYALTALLTFQANTRKRIVALVRKNLRTGTVLLITVIFIAVGVVYWFQRPDGKLHVTFGGAGAFIQTPSGKQLVFAGGGGVLPVMGRAMPLWDKAVELILLPQRNDLARADSLPILQRYKAGVVIQPDGEDEPSALLDQWTKQVRKQTGQVITMPIGSRAIIEPGVVLTLEQRINGAIGARLSYGSTTFELAGNTAVISGTVGNAEVIFVSVKGGSTAALNAAQPRWVVWADAGGAPFRLAEGIRAVALRDEGVIEFVSDGTTMTVNERGH